METLSSLLDPANWTSQVRFIEYVVPTDKTLCGYAGNRCHSEVVYRLSQLKNAFHISAIEMFDSTVVDCSQNRILVGRFLQLVVCHRDGCGAYGFNNTLRKLHDNGNETIPGRPWHTDESLAQRFRILSFLIDTRSKCQTGGSAVRMVQRVRSLVSGSQRLA
ncbi:MAG: hypothetical protein ACYS21_04155, partial [Planctomycetota bacterium]